MHLKQIELENFKSFGQKLTIPLLEGYTAVTGPNGSGKSNISDAILFVLGPKSSRAIRAGKLTDLIFNGGKSKKASTFTKVSLLFDNQDRMIPLNSDTVKLTRLVKLSQAGEGYNSYFYVNGRKSTLTEFDTLLSNSRISADGYNLVQQGDVTSIVEMTDLERRRILDDISGISHYDNDIAKAEEQREKAEQNIERISIILTELERQIEQLEKDRQTATKYLALQERLTLSRVQMAHKRKESTVIEIQSIGSQIRDHNRETEGLKVRRQEIISKTLEIDGLMNDVEREIDERGGEEFRELKERIDQVRIDLARTKDAMERALDDVQTIRGQQEERKEELEALEQEIGSLEGEFGGIISSIDHDSEVLQKERDEVADLEGSMRECDSELDSLENEVADLDGVVRSRDEELHTKRLENDRSTDRMERIRAEVANIEEEIKNLEFEVSDIDWNLKEIRTEDKDSSKKLKKAEEDFHTKKRLEGKLGREAEDLERAIHRLTREYNHLKAEAEAAENVARGYTRAVSAILEARDRGQIKGIHGTIAELARVDDKYETALNIAAGARMQSIVVDDDEVASNAIQFLKKGNLGRATFLPLSKMREYRPKGRSLMIVKETLGFAIDLIDFDESYRSAFSYVFGDTLVVDNLAKARKLMGGVRLVTLEGELIESSGAMVGGTIQSSKLKFGVSSRGKLEEIGKELQATTAHSEHIASELRQVRADLIEIERAIREINGSCDLKGDRTKALEAKKQSILVRLQETKSKRAERIEEKENLENQLKILVEEIETLVLELDKLKQEREEKRRKILDIAPKGLSQRLSDLHSHINQIASNLSELKGRKEGLETKIRLLKEKREELVALDKEQFEKISSLENEAIAFGERLNGLNAELKALRKIEESMGEEMESLRRRKEDLFKEKTRLDAERDTIDGKIETSSDFSIGLRTKLTIAEEKLKEIEEEIEQYDVEVELPLPTLERLKESIRECETSLARIGPVNLKSIEDYEEKKKRHENLNLEVERLETQRTDLLELMKDLNEKKKGSFLQVFESVGENFRRVYSELSGGGEAELALANPKEPFEAGLIIRARPRTGKTLRLQALSGGEKSLTALSFIFAIQEYHPSPFYLLDEVDMFLDAVNADMVARRIQNASRSAQFVQITLRKVTMDKADHILGVTMQEAGISKVIMRPNMSEGMFTEPKNEAATEGTA
jgi:chromosome segregation protein